MKLSAIFPVFGNAQNKKPARERSEHRSITRRGSEAVINGKNVILEGVMNTGRMMAKMPKKLKRKMSESHDTDLSDKNTREKHQVIYRSDGTKVIKAMQSTQNVVKKFKLRSNSIVSADSTLGALQAVEASIKNIEMESVALKKVRRQVTRKQNNPKQTSDTRICTPRASSPRTTYDIESGGYSF
jgi:hypothetical protein